MELTKSCPHCGLAQADQHSLRESAICDGIKSGKVDRALGQAAVKERVTLATLKKRLA